MEEITNLMGSICISIIAIGIISKLGAFDATEKMLRFVAAISILLILYESFDKTSLNIDFKYPESDVYYIENTSALKNEIINKTKTDLEQMIKERLDEKNISYNSVSLHILEQNGSIAVDKIIIDCSSDAKTAVIDCIQDIISKETEILTGEQK